MEGEAFNYRELVNKLPKRKAPEHIWQRLQTSAYAPDLSDIPAYYPPTALWNRIAESQRKAVFRRRLKRGAILGLLALALATGAILIPDNFTGLNREVAYEPAREPEAGRKPEMNSFISVMPRLSISGNEIENTGPHPMSIRTTEARAGMKPVNGNYSDHTNAIHMKSLNTPALSISDSRLMNLKDRIDCSPFKGGGNTLSFGLSYERMLFDNNEGYQDTKLNSYHALGLNLKLDYGRFHFITGAGVNISGDENHWKYDYLKEELVDTYVYVDSVHYNPETGETSYFTSIVEVYDSISYTSYKSTSKNNFYLSIPLLAGYKLYETTKIGISLQGGVNYTYLLRSNEIKVKPDEPDARITDVYFKRTNRKLHNLNVVGRLNLEWKVSRKFKLNFYPSVNYFITPLYEGKSGSLPLLAGFGLGVYFN